MFMALLPSHALCMGSETCGEDSALHFQCSLTPTQKPWGSVHYWSEWAFCCVVSSMTLVESLPGVQSLLPVVTQP